jgi:hypothetical protein
MSTCFIFNCNSWIYVCVYIYIYTYTYTHIYFIFTCGGGLEAQHLKWSLTVWYKPPLHINVKFGCQFWNKCFTRQNLVLRIKSIPPKPPNLVLNKFVYFEYLRNCKAELSSITQRDVCGVIRFTSVTPRQKTACYERCAKFWLGSLKERNHLEDLGLDWRIVLKLICPVAGTGSESVHFVGYQWSTLHCKDLFGKYVTAKFEYVFPLLLYFCTLAAGTV